MIYQAMGSSSRAVSGVPVAANATLTGPAVAIRPFDTHPGINYHDQRNQKPWPGIAPRARL
jgi:hypothetical protein